MTSIIIPSRRGFLLGLSASVLAAPAIVRVSSLMTVRPMSREMLTLEDFAERILKPNIIRYVENFYRNDKLNKISVFSNGTTERIEL